MKKILLADECDFTRNNLKECLNSSGFTTFCACNGKIAKKIYDSENPPVIVTAIVMPEMDGIELITYIRKHSKNTQIIAISDYGNKVRFDYKKTALLLGANAFFRKPVDMEDLLQYINKCVNC